MFCFNFFETILRIITQYQVPISHIAVAMATSFCTLSLSVILLLYSWGPNEAPIEMPSFLYDILDCMEHLAEQWNSVVWLSASILSMFLSFIPPPINKIKQTQNSIYKH